MHRFHHTICGVPSMQPSTHYQSVPQNVTKLCPLPMRYSPRILADLRSARTTWSIDRYDSSDSTAASKTMHAQLHWQHRCRMNCSQRWFAIQLEVCCLGIERHTMGSGATAEHLVRASGPFSESWGYLLFAQWALQGPLHGQSSGLSSHSQSRIWF